MHPDAEFAALLFGSLRSGLVAIGTDGRIAGLNAEARRILDLGGDPAEPCLGRPCREVLEGQPTFVDLLCSALDGRDRPSRAELALEPGSGSVSRTIGFTLACVRDSAGAVHGSAMVFRDLAPIERLDEQERLRERLVALGEMAAGLAHEIRNPLASMEVLAGLIDRQLEPLPEARELLAELRAELHSLADTVTASLDFVKPAAPARSALDPVALVEECLALARARVDFTGQVERRYASALPRVAVDAEQLRTALGNLILNALEAMAGDAGNTSPRLRLEIAVGPTDAASARLRVGRRGVEASSGTGRELVIRVADSGPGVPPELRERIFYPFYTGKASGSGVGLALAQKFVASHGGDLALEARSERGASFRIRLPLDEAAG